MRYLALACSYDETIAVDGRIDQATEAGLRRLVASGRQLVLLSRRPLDELLATLPEHLFVWIVAEYGGLLHHPGTRMGRPLADPIPHAVVQGLRDREVTPLAVGQVSVATSQANQAALQEVVQEAGVELEVVADKDQVLAVPAGVDKATGLDAALQELELSAHNLVGVGHAATDQGFLGRCAVAVAVANAAEALKQRCDLVTKRPAGAGVVELVDRLVTEDLADLDTQLGRYRLLLGHDQDQPVTAPAYGANLLLAGPSGTGKSTLAAGLLERLAEQDYQVLVLDPEGDHEDFQNAVHLGDRHDPPGIDQLLAALQEPGQRVVANLLGRRLEELPGYLNQFLRRLPELRTRTGRPHFLMLEEAHHFLPLPGERGAFVLPRWVDGLIMATVNPEHVSPTALWLADTVVTFGDAAASGLERYCQAIGEPPPQGAPRKLPAGAALAFRRAGGRDLVRFQIAGGASERRPHLRRWAESELDAANSFYFRGPKGRLRLRAATLQRFVLLAEGVDEDTWQHHLRQGDYSAWFRTATHDEVLAEHAAEVEQGDLPADQSRQRILTVIRDRYLPAP